MVNLKTLAITSAIISIVSGFSAVSGIAQEPSVERSSFFTLNEGDRIEDSGVIAVESGRFARSEAFEVVRHAEGGRTITSIITGADGSYRVEGRWSYDATEHAIGADGKASYNGVPASINIVATPPTAAITVRAGAVERTIPAPCDPDCLIDMAPSALPMFTMTRRYDASVGGEQTFRWIGQGLAADQVLLEGVAKIRLLDRQTVGDVDVSHFIFVETLTDAKTGAVTSFAFNLWVDADHRPLAFGMTSGTLGVRKGFEAVPAAMPAQFAE